MCYTLGLMGILVCLLVNIFLWIVGVLHVIVTLLWVMSLVFVLNEECYAWHILSSLNQLRAATYNVSEDIDEYHFRVTLHPLIEQRLEER